MLCKKLAADGYTYSRLIPPGSLIISSVACGESLPFVIQSLWHGSQQWVPILISTFTMALYAEILPQYLIPRHPIVWGYYCAPIIWGCMWLTGIVSYPLACLLDTIAGRSPGYSIFTREEMAAVIKYHDLSENSHGTIGPDATRVMLGALNLDSRSIGGDIALVPETNTSVEKDVEKADPIVLQELLVHWSDVKTVDIDDVVDDKFMSRVNDWSYSCIPVLGKHEFHKVEMDPATVEYRWEGRQLFGFLHIKVSIVPALEVKIAGLFLLMVGRAYSTLTLEMQSSQWIR
jgi:metal transporter CNNM